MGGINAKLPATVETAPSVTQLRTAMIGMPTVVVEMATAMAETVEEAEKVEKAAEAVNLPPALVPAAHSAVATTTIAEKVIYLRQHLHPLGLLHPPRRPTFHRCMKYGYASSHGLKKKILPMTCFNGMPMQKNSSPMTVHQTSIPPHRSQEKMAIPDPPPSAENPMPGPKTARHRNPYGTSAEAHITSQPAPLPLSTTPLSSGLHLHLLC